MIPGQIGAPREAVLPAEFALLSDANFGALSQVCQVRHSYPEMLAVITAMAFWFGRRSEYVMRVAADGRVGAQAGTG